MSNDQCTNTPFHNTTGEQTFQNAADASKPTTAMWTAR